MFQSFFSLHRAHSSAPSRRSLYLLALGLITGAGALAQEAGFSVEGHVLNAAHQPVSGVSVRLTAKPTSGFYEVRSKAQGVFVFTGVARGTYTISLDTTDGGSSAITNLQVTDTDQRGIELIMQADALAIGGASASMEFADSPRFSVAGVTDWTAAGGHGSDVSLRTSEELTRDTLTLRPEVAAPSQGAGEGTDIEAKLREAVAQDAHSYSSNHQLGHYFIQNGQYAQALPFLKAADRADSSKSENQYDLSLALLQAGDSAAALVQVLKSLGIKDSADLHRLAGEIYEKRGDPLSAVRQYETAVRLEPSEPNYFAWGSELLLHRAVLQAVEVFRDASKAHPTSSRMLTALGTALFASALYDEAAASLCAASALNPAYAEPYLFMGRVELAAPAPLPCIEQNLARFAASKPETAYGDYLYAMALIKRQEQAGDHDQSTRIESLLSNAVTLDPKCKEALLQLGIINFSKREYQRAIGLYLQAIAVDPQLGEAHYRLGVAYDRTGQHAKAMEEFEQHDEIERTAAAEVESHRREVKQYSIVVQGQPTHPAKD